MEPDAPPSAPPRARARLRLVDVNPHLVCFLCGGYYVDATTITECLHSFCKSCIIRYLETNSFCPICDVQIHKAKPYRNLRPDKALQNIVYKLVPDLYHNEMDKRRKFYAQHPEYALPQKPEDRGMELERMIFSPRESISISLQYFQPEKEEWDNRSDSSNGSGPDSFFGGSSLPSGLRYLLCPSLVTVSLLKKFLRLKFELPESHQVDVLHKREVLTDELSLMDIAYIYTWKRNGPMALHYRFHEAGRAPDPCSAFLLPSRAKFLFPPRLHPVSAPSAPPEALAAPGPSGAPPAPAARPGAAPAPPGDRERDARASTHFRRAEQESKKNTAKDESKEFVKNSPGKVKAGLKGKYTASSIIKKSKMSEKRRNVRKLTMRHNGERKTDREIVITDSATNVVEASSTTYGLTVQGIASPYSVMCSNTTPGLCLSPVHASKMHFGSSLVKALEDNSKVNSTENPTDEILPVHSRKESREVSREASTSYFKDPTTDSNIHDNESGSSPAENLEENSESFSRSSLPADSREAPKVDPRASPDSAQESMVLSPCKLSSSHDSSGELRIHESPVSADSSNTVTALTINAGKVVAAADTTGSPSASSASSPTESLEGTDVSPEGRKKPPTPPPVHGASTPKAAAGERRLQEPERPRISIGLLASLALQRRPSAPARKRPAPAPLAPRAAAPAPAEKRARGALRPPPVPGLVTLRAPPPRLADVRRAFQPPPPRDFAQCFASQRPHERSGAESPPAHPLGHNRPPTPAPHRQTASPPGAPSAPRIYGSKLSSIPRLIQIQPLSAAGAGAGLRRRRADAPPPVGLCCDGVGALDLSATRATRTSHAPDIATIAQNLARRQLLQHAGCASRGPPAPAQRPASLSSASPSPPADSASSSGSAASLGPARSPRLPSLELASSAALLFRSRFELHPPAYTDWYNEQILRYLDSLRRGEALPAPGAAAAAAAAAAAGSPFPQYAGGGAGGGGGGGGGARGGRK